METDPGKDLEQSLIDLLAVAKLWMPDLMFDIDPRIRRARQLAAILTQVSESRPPPIFSLSDELTILDLAPPPTLAEVERMTTLAPPWDITAGLDAFMASDLAPESRTEATILIIRDWLVGHGYILPTPEHEEIH